MATGASYARLRICREAIQVITESLTLKPKNTGAYVNRAFAYSKLGDLLQARLGFEKGGAMGNVEPGKKQIVVRSCGRDMRFQREQ